MAIKRLPPYFVSGIGVFLTNLFFIGKPPPVKTSNGDLARGWGDHILWCESLDTAFHRAKVEHKPVMLIVHRGSCNACKLMKAYFSQNKEIAEMSRSLVMINRYTHELPREPKYFPDGNYVPRFLFFSPNGKFLENVVFRENVKTKYGYDSTESVAKNMLWVIESPYATTPRPSST